MTKGYFNWSTCDNVAGAYELQRRSIIRTLRADSDIMCWAKNCGKRPKRGDQCYYPSRTTSTQNNVIGHKTCIDRICAEHTAKSAGDEQAARVKDLILSIPEDVHNYASSDMPDFVKRLLSDITQNASSKREREAYWRGYADALREVQKNLQDSA